jgi:hypothetical protein
LIDPAPLIHRNYASHYTAQILITSREDIELLLGKEALEPKQHTEKSRSEFIVSELYPAKLNYSTKTELLVVGIDYVTRIAKVSADGKEFDGYFKPAEQGRRNVAKEEALKARRNRAKKRAGSELEQHFIDNENLIRVNREGGDDALPVSAEDLPAKRKRTKSIIYKFYFAN